MSSMEDPSKSTDMSSMEDPSKSTDMSSMEDPYYLNPSINRYELMQDPCYPQLTHMILCRIRTIPNPLKSSDLK